MNITAQLHWSLVLIIIGVILIVGGAAVMFLFASIPGPDDPPATAAKEATAGKIAFGAMLLGAVSFAIGAIASVVRLLIRRRLP